jgi:hypothetical protein
MHDVTAPEKLLTKFKKPECQIHQVDRVIY